MSDLIHIQSISQVHQLLGLTPPKHPLVSILPIDDRMASFDYGDHRYVFDFYQVSLKQGVSGSMVYGRNSYDFEEGTMTFLKPDQAVKIEDARALKGAFGWTLLFHPDLIRRSELAKNIRSYSFFNYEINEALHLSDEEIRSLNGLKAKIETEYSQNLDKHSQELIVSNLDLLLKYCKRYYDRQFYTRANYNLDLISEFDHVIADYYGTGMVRDLGVLTVAYCADRLNMSANYLGDLLKTETGKSAKEHIQLFIVDRAKTEILSSNQSISEIAYGFGFEHPQSFNRLFKAKTGMTPTAFRNRN